MLVCFSVIIGLLCYTGTINSMELINGSPRSCSITARNESEMLTFSDKKLVKKHKELYGVDTLVITGGRYSNSYGRIKLNITQVAVDNGSEMLIINAEENVLPYLMVNQCENCLTITLDSLPKKMELNEDIVVFLALKKYATIVTQKYIDTCFLSPIRTENFSLSLSLGARMRLSPVFAKKIHVDLEGDREATCELVGDEKDFLIADLLSINNKGNAHAALAVKTALLHVNNRDKGSLVVEGTATAQDLVLFEGSFNASELESRTISMAVGKGGGTIHVWATESINGIQALDSEHDVTFKAPHSRPIWLSVVNAISLDGIVS